MPIIVLSGQADDQDVIASLNLGANDYITKPFNIDVLLARINATLRTAAVQETGGTFLQNGLLKMDLVRHEVFLDNDLITFTPKEYDLLRYLMVNSGKMLLHKDILKNVWGGAHGEDITYLRVYISNIRQKIEPNPAAPVFIKTEAGIGYRMETIPSPLEQAA